MNNTELLKKYNPKSLDEILCQDITIKILKNMIKNNELHNMIFYGDYGIGKTLTISNFINEFYINNINLHVLKLLVTDNRGVNDFRLNVIPFVSTNNFIDNKKKLIVIDDFDLMKNDSQNLLKYIMDHYSNNCKFCIICNNLNKVNISLQIRCIKFKFNKIKKLSLLKKVENICKLENIKYTKNSLELLNYNNDYRKLINNIYFINNIEKKINASICKKNISIISQDNILKNIKNKSLHEIIKYIECLNLINNFDNNLFLTTIFKLWPFLKKDNYNIIEFINDLYKVINSYTKIFDNEIINCQFSLILFKIGKCL